MNRHTHFCAMTLATLVLTACNPASDEGVTQDQDTQDVVIQDVVTPDPELTVQIERDDIAYLAQLARIRGHLFVGVTLYREGEIDEAVTHLDHPGNELYVEIRPGLQARGAEDYAGRLETLAVAVESEAPVAQVDQHYEALVLAVRQAEEVVDLNAAQAAQVINTLLDDVVSRYPVAIGENGILMDAHEYQVCLGLVQVANGYIDTLQELSNQALSIRGLRQQMAFLQEVFPTTVPSPREPLTPPATVNEVIERIGVTLTGFPL